MSETISYPRTPYVGQVKLEEGSKINIQGVPEYNQPKFSISLQGGPDIKQNIDVPFWIIPRFNEKNVVVKGKSGGFPLAEKILEGFPFQQGQLFNVEILVTSQMYEVTVNGQKCGNYKNTTPIRAVTHLAVSGGIKIYQIHFEIPFYYPGVFPTRADPMRNTVAPIFNPPTPFVKNIPGGMYPGMIFISGVSGPKQTGFSISLQNGVTYEPDDIGLMVEARFNSDRNVLVYNHRKRGSWGQKDREVSDFSFNPNAQFEMIILIEEYRYKVAVNNQHVLLFEHQIEQLSKIDTLRIEGSVVLTQIRFQ